MASIYSFEVRDNYGRLVTVLNRPMNRQFSLYRNRAGSCQFTLDLFDPQATAAILALNQNDICIRRSGTPVFAGQISYVHPIIDGDKKQVEVIATGYFDLLDQRVVNTDMNDYDALHSQIAYPTTDVSQLAWQLVTDSQFLLSADGSKTSNGPGLTLAESFIAPTTGAVTDMKLLLLNTSATGNFIVGIYTDANGTPGSLVANSQVTIPVANIGSAQAEWYDIPYTSSQPSLTKGTKYWIRAWMDTTQTGSNGIYWSYLNNSYYIQGKAYSPENPALFTSGQNLQFYVGFWDYSYQMTKNSYMGIQKGNLPTSFTLAPTFARYKKVKDAIEDLAHTFNSIDFDISIAIDANNNLYKTFNTFYPRQGVNNTSLNFSYPGNIIKIERPKDGKTMVNEVSEQGQGYGLNQLVDISYDTSSIQTYGLRQDVEHNPDVDTQPTLNSLGQEFIRVRKDPLDLPELVLDGNVAPHIGDYNVGDQILVSIQGSDIMALIGTYRIEQIESQITDDDQEQVTLTLSLA